MSAPNYSARRQRVLNEVGIDAGFGQGWQQWGRQWSHLCHFGDIHYVPDSRVNSQIDIIVATFFECQEADLALALPLIPYCPTAPSPACPPSTASMLYPPPYATVILGQSLLFLLSSSSPCLLSLLSCLLYIHALPMLTDDTWSGIFRCVYSPWYVHIQCGQMIDPNVNAEDAE